MKLTLIFNFRTTTHEIGLSETAENIFNFLFLIVILYRLDKIKLAADLRNYLQSVVNCAETKLYSFSHFRKTFLTFYLHG